MLSRRGQPPLHSSLQAEFKLKLTFSSWLSSAGRSLGTSFRCDEVGSSGSNGGLGMSVHIADIMPFVMSHWLPMLEIKQRRLGQAGSSDLASLLNPANVDLPFPCRSLLPNVYTHRLSPQCPPPRIPRAHPSPPSLPRSPRPNPPLYLQQLPPLLPFYPPTLPLPQPPPISLSMFPLDLTREAIASSAFDESPTPCRT
jgi:hypothetical protein